MRTPHLQKLRLKLASLHAKAICLTEQASADPDDPIDAKLRPMLRAIEELVAETHDAVADEIERRHNLRFRHPIAAAPAAKKK
jgi:hypothetical protein